MSKLNQIKNQIAEIQKEIQEILTMIDGEQPTKFGEMLSRVEELSNKQAELLKELDEMEKDGSKESIESDEMTEETKDEERPTVNVDLYSVIGSAAVTVGLGLVTKSLAVTTSSAVAGVACGIYLGSKLDKDDERVTKDKVISALTGATASAVTGGVAYGAGSLWSNNRGTPVQESDEL